MEGKESYRSGPYRTRSRSTEWRYSFCVSGRKEKKETLSGKRRKVRKERGWVGLWSNFQFETLGMNQTGIAHSAPPVPSVCADSQQLEIQSSSICAASSFSRRPLGPAEPLDHTTNQPESQLKMSFTSQYIFSVKILIFSFFPRIDRHLRPAFLHISLDRGFHQWTDYLPPVTILNALELNSKSKIRYFLFLCCYSLDGFIRQTGREYSSSLQQGVCASATTPGLGGEAINKQGR